jgi:hypothetical protein
VLQPTAARRLGFEADRIRVVGTRQYDDVLIRNRTRIPAEITPTSLRRRDMGQQY